MVFTITNLSSAKYIKHDSINRKNEKIEKVKKLQTLCLVLQLMLENKKSTEEYYLPLNDITSPDFIKRAEISDIDELIQYLTMILEAMQKQFTERSESEH